MTARMLLILDVPISVFHERQADLHSSTAAPANSPDGRADIH